MNDNRQLAEMMSPDDLAAAKQYREIIESRAAELAALIVASNATEAERNADTRSKIADAVRNEEAARVLRQEQRALILARICLFMVPIGVCLALIFMWGTAMAITNWIGNTLKSYHMPWDISGFTGCLIVNIILEIACIGWLIYMNLEWIKDAKKNLLGIATGSRYY